MPELQSGEKEILSVVPFKSVKGMLSRAPDALAGLRFNLFTSFANTEGMLDERHKAEYIVELKKSGIPAEIAGQQYAADLIAIQNTPARLLMRLVLEFSGRLETAEQEQTTPGSKRDLLRGFRFNNLPEISGNQLDVLLTLREDLATHMRVNQGKNEQYIDRQAEDYIRMLGRAGVDSEVARQQFESDCESIQARFSGKGHLQVAQV